VIPAVRTSRNEAVRILFFDDNIEWAGKATSSGIVNLRDIENGEFVNFGEGENGFKSHRFATNTIVHSSTEFNNVLVQANILDAMEDEGYFNNILDSYTKPDEKCLIFMDINSTIISVDAVSGKDMAQMVLGTMFEFITMIPNEPFVYHWRDGARPPIDVKKTMHLKKFVKEICKDAKDLYDHFYTYDNCMQVIISLVDKVELRWSQQEGDFTLKSFKDLYERYLVTLDGGTTPEGITRSWLKCYQTNQLKNALILNTFGIDSRKVIVKTVEDERQVLHMAISFDKWYPKDKKLFEKNYGSL
jgi:hypothetical protein